MTMPTHHVNHELIQAAAQVARSRCRGDNHTMAAAARARDGRIITAVNAYHGFRRHSDQDLVGTATTQLTGIGAGQWAYTVIIAIVPPCAA